MQETKETEEKNKDGITIQELTEKIRQMDQEEFIVTVSLEGGLADGREKIDSETGEPVKDENGNPVTEEASTTIPRFKVYEG